MAKEVSPKINISSAHIQGSSLCHGKGGHDNKSIPLMHIYKITHSHMAEPNEHTPSFLSITMTLVLD